MTFYKYCFDAVLLLYFCSHSMTASGCLCALHSITAASGYSYSNVFPARGFHGPRRCTQVLHWQLALKMRNAWENGERGAEQGCKCNDEGGVGYATQSINIFFLIFPIASIIFFFFIYINILLKFLARANHSEIVEMELQRSCSLKWNMEMT